jgi:hypothetical protein
MFTINVYKLCILVDTKKVLADFYTVENREGEIYWKTGDEARENFRHRHDPSYQKRGGKLGIWFTGDRVRLVLPEWELWVNGKQCERGYYRELRIKWPKVELTCGAYLFEFLKPELEGHESVELPRPRPSVRPKDLDIDNYSRES